MCDGAVSGDSYSLQYVSDWIVMQELVKSWHDDHYYCKYDELVEWYHGYKQYKVQKAEIKEGLMPIAWHSTRIQDWCMTEDRRKKIKEIFT